MTDSAIAVPARYRCEVTHRRFEGVRNEFVHSYDLWLVDVDEPPRGFRSADHFGDPNASLRSNVDGFLAANGVDSRHGRVLMLAQPRVLGHVFNPLSIFWCFDAGGELSHVIAEVRNTFGELHCYLVRPDADGRALVSKAMYVSPFFGVDGEYSMRFSLTDDLVAATMVLRRGEGTALVAVLRGTRCSRLSRAPFSTHRVTALIHYEAWRLRRRGLPLRRRRFHQPQEAT